MRSSRAAPPGQQEAAVMVLAVVLQLWVAQAGCTKDTDCKGDRICEAGVCVSPKPAVESVSPPPTPPPPPPANPPPETTESWPRVIRRDGLVCVQAPGADGRIEESCRKDEPVRRALPSNEPAYEPPPRARTKASRRARLAEEEPAAEEPAARFVLDGMFHGGVTFLTSATLSLAVPQLSGTLALGARFRSGVGVMGFGNVQGMIVPRTTAIFGTIAPALRLGDRSHFTLAGGVAFGGVSNFAGSVAGTMFTVHAQGVFAIAGAFALSLQGAVFFDPSGAFFTFGAGFGFGAF